MPTRHFESFKSTISFIVPLLLRATEESDFWGCCNKMYQRLERTMKEFDDFVGPGKICRRFDLMCCRLEHGGETKTKLTFDTFRRIVHAVASCRRVLKSCQEQMTRKQEIDSLSLSGLRISFFDLFAVRVV